MKNTAFYLIGSVVCICLQTGCSQTESPKPAPTDNSPAAQKPPTMTPSPGTQPPAQPVTSSVPTAVPAQVSKATPMAGGQGNDLASPGKSSADAALKDIGTRLAASSQSLLQSLAGNADLKGMADSAAGSLLSGKDTQVMGLYQKLGSAQLTDAQSRLLKEVKDLSAAYLTQKNFSGLPGVEGDVTKLVSAFQKGDYASLLVPLKNIYGNASLTGPQKEIVGSLVDSYAPDLKKYGDTLNKLNSFVK